MKVDVDLELKKPLSAGPIDPCWEPAAFLLESLVGGVPLRVGG